MCLKMPALIDEIIKEGIGNGAIPGAVVLWGRHNSIVCEKAYGNREVKPEKIKMDKNTIFDLASITKAIATATSIMILEEEKKLSIEDKVVKYIPEFEQNGKGAITLKMLLTHYSGLSNNKYDNTPNRIVERICGAKRNKKFRLNDSNLKWGKSSANLMSLS